MKPRENKVFIVDDDSGVRKSIRMLLRSVGIESEAFATAKHFLDAYDPNQPGCLILDVRMPSMSGVELQQKLSEMGGRIPIIFITAHGDIPMAVNAIKSGAVDFIQKPFRDQELLDRVQEALKRDAETRTVVLDREQIARRLASLTPREKQVTELVVDGNANKVIAAKLSLSERTIEIHRARAMKKMEAESLPHLVQMMMRLKS